MTRNKHYVGLRMNAASGAVAGNAAANLWNPAANARIFIYEVWIASTAATAFNIGIRRSTTVGTTPGATVTLAQDNSIERDVAAPSAAVLNTSAYATQPTVGTAILARWNLPGAIGAGVILPFPDPITLPPGTGMAVTTETANAAPICDITFVVGD